MNPDEIAKAIDTGEVHPHQVDEGSSFGRALSGALRSLGWETRTMHDYCTKATYEDHLTKNGRRCDIESAVFMGAFTSITCWRA